jgi:LysM domain
MEHQHGAHAGWVERWRPAAVPLAATILLLLERELVDGFGSPATLVRMLSDLGQSWADPVDAVLAAMALAVEALVGYSLVVLVLRSLSALPGSTGRLAARLTSLVTPVVARRLLDLLVGGALLTQAALAGAPGVPAGPRWGASRLTSIISLPFSGSIGSATASDPAPTSLGTGWLHWPVDPTDPIGARPNPRRSAVPLPPWLGGGPSNATPGLREETGDTGVPGHREHAGATTVPRRREQASDTTAPGHRQQAATTTTTTTTAPRSPEDTGDAKAPGHGDQVGGSTPMARHVVEVGDTLWDIAAARLVPAERSAANIDRYWRQIYRANRAVIGADPDLLHPGTRLRVPPFRRSR